MIKSGANLQAQRASATDLVITHLQALAPVGPEAVDVLHGLDGLRTHPAGSELLGERDAANRPRFLVHGWAARVRELADGRRQIIGFVLPGDAMALCRRPSPIATCNTVALTPVHTLDATEVMLAIGVSGPAGADLAEALAIAASLDECSVINHVVRLGRQTAYERMCHLLLELRDRLARVGLVMNQRFQLPLTQETLADATGLSAVHVNRILQQLRREKLIDLHNGHVDLLNPQQLEIIADYRPIRTAPWRTSS